MTLIVIFWRNSNSTNSSSSMDQNFPLRSIVSTVHWMPGCANAPIYRSMSQCADAPKHAKELPRLLGIVALIRAMERIFPASAFMQGCADVPTTR